MQSKIVIPEFGSNPHLHAAVVDLVEKANRLFLAKLSDYAKRGGDGVEFDSLLWEFREPEDCQKDMLIGFVFLSNKGKVVTSDTYSIWWDPADRVPRFGFQSSDESLEQAIECMFLGLMVVA